MTTLTTETRRLLGAFRACDLVTCLEFEGLLTEERLELLAGKLAKVEGDPTAWWGTLTKQERETLTCALRRWDDVDPTAWWDDVVRG